MNLTFSQKISSYDFLGLCSFVTSPQAGNRGRDSGLLHRPSLRTVRADFPHTALQSALLFPDAQFSFLGFFQTE